MSSFQVLATSSKGAGPSMLEGKSGYGSTMQDSPKFTSGDYPAATQKLFLGTTYVFEGEEAMIAAISEDPMSFKGKVVVIRGEGPKGGPGMPEMLTPTSAIMGAGLGNVIFRV
uniref:Dihydroxy-acid/6-phosphogluconate dehydratase C-terminal domain-containing protein n=1 Tax=Lactuca sativa TaxID=4236 RepID=A0A9R1VQ72_LACSA|nr:hypothetical protein LSAT_V11C400219670 [Lactuca sativa]